MDSDNETQCLSIYLQKYRLTTDEKDYTHLCYGDPWGKYRIKDENDFLDAYGDAYEDEQELHLIERQKNVGPLLVDLDFKFSGENSERQYTQNHITNIVKIFTQVIKKYYDSSETSLYRAYVFEKPEPTYDKTKNEYKDGFHIQYPNLPIDKCMRYLILMEAKQMIVSNKILKDLDYINSIDDIFDVSVVYRNGWLMYGSKKQNGQVYRLKKIYNHEIEQLKNKHSAKELIKLLSIRKFDDNDKLNIKIESKTDEFNERYNQAVLIFDKEKKTKKESHTQNNYNNSTTTNTNNFEDKQKTRKQVLKLLNIMDISRAIDYSKWIHIGWALHNIDIDLLDCFIDFSKKYPPKFDIDVIYKLWEKAKPNGFSLASIHWWAKNDNPSEYAKIIRQEVNELILEAENGTHYNIACVLYAMYKHTFVCTSISKSTWYEFKNHRWREVDHGYTLDKIISETLTKEFALLASTYYAQLQNKEGLEKERILERAKKISKIIEKLCDSKFKKNIMDECAKLFYIDKFEESLDDNKDILGFNNGIFDLVNGVLRDGTPDDRITLTTDYDFIELSMEHEKVKEVDNFFKKIMLEDDMREYLYLLIASYLEGHIRQQHLVLWTGSGSNGKSSCTDLIKYTFGQYYDVLPVTVLTRKRGSSSNATPELANKRGVRFIALQEPECDDQIYVGYMKELTGGDWIMARPLYKEPFRFKPQFKLVIPCNKLPNIPSDDGGTWRRLRVTPWESKFVDGTPIGPNEFVKDFTLGEKIKTWNQAFIWILLRIYFPIYVANQNQIKEPAKVTKHTDEYKMKSDQYLLYLRDNYDLSNNSFDNKILIKEIYVHFQTWFKENAPKGTTCPIKNEFVEYFKNKPLYKVDSKFIYGLKLKDEL